MSRGRPPGRTGCPRCAHGAVDVGTAVWVTQGGRMGARRSVWVEEPLRCTRGCLVDAGAVQGLLLRAYRAPLQLPLLALGEEA